MPRILLIELSATVRHIERNLLIKAGYEVETDLDFRSALVRFRPGSEEGGAFDGVVLGWPDMTIPGAEALYSILERETYASLPVLILAHEAESEITDRVASRPNAAFLLWAQCGRSPDLLAQLLVDASSRKPRQTGTKPIVQPIRVLFVDDSRTVRVKYQRLLTANGYHAATAATVAEGFDKAVASQYDIAIIDYFMPDATGDVLCQRLRDHEATATVTTAIITGTYLDKAIKQSLEAGAVECMFKNESDDLFLTRIDAMS
ncbi:MAG: response regulator, partial [Candidatus Thiodiazotropha sp. (ex Codakia orbicularis)]|nr:response regulator [Candidatus Thiodiazotropha sp. (ex Codakia orbicularis)]